ncbi:MAG TPA: PAS domain-containing sensor histidine kinase [Burkholderiales bacterium]
METFRPVAAWLQRIVDKLDPHEGRYRMLFESSPLPMWVFDAGTLRYLAVNDSAVRLYGYSREEFLLMTVEDLRVPGEGEAFREFLRRESGTVHRGLFRHLKKTGELIDVESVGHFVRWRGRDARLVMINDVTERLRIQMRLRALSQRLLEVQEDERRSLARDLHDDIGQALTALKIQLESLAKAGEETPRRVDECVETTRHTLERVRQLSLSLRPLQLDDLGLVAALRSHLDRQAGLGGLAPHFDSGEAPPQLPPEIETACFRVAQEAITNVLRHARARNLWLRLFTAGDRLALSVRDDGGGFDPEAARRRAAAGGSMGLAGMEERVAIAGGSIELRSAAGQGTVLLATFPLQRAAGDRDR